MTIKDQIKNYEDSDKAEIEMNVFKITGKIDRNMGTIIIEAGCSVEFFNDFMESVWTDFPAGAEMPIGYFKVKLKRMMDTIE